LRPVARRSKCASRRRQQFAAEDLEGGDEGLALVAEVFVEGLVGGPRRGRDRRDAERLIAPIDHHPGGGPDDPLALSQLGPATAGGWRAPPSGPGARRFPPSTPPLARPTTRRLRAHLPRAQAPPPPLRVGLLLAQLRVDAHGTRPGELPR